MDRDFWIYVGLSAFAAFCFWMDRVKQRHRRERLFSQISDRWKPPPREQERE